MPASRLAFRSNDTRVLRAAFLQGAGIGFLPVFEGEAHDTLREVYPRQEGWSSPLWLVTHVDLHRTTKVQTFLRFLKETAKDWSA